MLLNTRGTGAAQKNPDKAFYSKELLGKIFHAPIWFQWKAVTRARHAPKFCHACHAWKCPCQARYLVDNCHVFQFGSWTL